MWDMCRRPHGRVKGDEARIQRKLRDCAVSSRGGQTSASLVWWERGCVSETVVVVLGRPVAARLPADLLLTLPWGAACGAAAAPYTHLILPTTSSVAISVGSGPLP